MLCTQPPCRWHPVWALSVQVNLPWAPEKYLAPKKYSPVFASRSLPVQQVGVHVVPLFWAVVVITEACTARSGHGDDLIQDIPLHFSSFTLQHTKSFYLVQARIFLHRFVFVCHAVGAFLRVVQVRSHPVTVAPEIHFSSGLDVVGGRENRPAGDFR